MRWVSYTRSISSRIGEENPANTIAEQNANIEQYLKNKGYRISEKYSDRKRSAEAADGFDRMVQDGMTQKFDAVAVDSIFRFGKTLPFAIEVLQKTFYPVGIQFAVVEDDFCSTDRTADEVEQYFKEKVIEKIRFEFMASRQDSFEKGVLTHRQAKYGYDISEDRRSFVLDSESAYIVKLIFQMYLEGMTLQEIGAALDAQNVPSPQIQMTRNKKVTRKTKWPVTTIRSILVNPLYIGKLTLKLSGAEKKMEVPPIVSEEDFQKVQERINDSVKLPAPKRRSTPNILIKKIYDRASGERLLCRTTEDETRQAVNSRVARAIKTVFTALEVVNQGMQEKKSMTLQCVDVDDLKKQAEMIRAEQIKLYESYADGILTRNEYLEKKKGLGEKLADLQEKIRIEEEEQETADELDEEIRSLTKQTSQKTYIGGLTKECVDAFVSMVYLYDDQTMKVEFNCEDVIRRALEKYGA